MVKFNIEGPVHERLEKYVTHVKDYITEQVSHFPELIEEVTLQFMFRFFSVDENRNCKYSYNSEPVGVGDMTARCFASTKFTKPIEKKYELFQVFHSMENKETIPYSEQYDMFLHSMEEDLWSSTGRRFLEWSVGMALMEKQT